MKTRCYCTYCPNHPKFEQRHSLGSPPTGFCAGRYIPSNFAPHGAEVDCLQPVSKAFGFPWELDPNDFDYPVTAYGDGSAESGMDTAWLTLYAGCGNEKYQN